MAQSFLIEDYQLYFEQDFRHRWLRPHHLYEKLEKYRNHQDLIIEKVGMSFQGRDIHITKWGNGPITVLCWTQMHGNEPTSTMAVVDLLNFLLAQDKYDELRNVLKKQIQVVIVPMLNPDGAEVFSRRNALGIDPNRDALTQQTPEIRTLLKVVKELKPEWCFNLHDQRNIFSAGKTNNTATISFLAASADVDKTLAPVRKLSMQMIGTLKEAIEELLPHKIGRYSDEYYHRALGEHFHKNEIPCILIESGAHKDDPLRDLARKANFIALLSAFETIATGKIKNGSTEVYKAIPENDINMLDLIIRDCEIDLDQGPVKVDIGLLYEEKPNFNTNTLDRYFVINDIGDLQFQFGIEEELGAVLVSDYKDLKLDSPANFTVRLSNNTTIELKNGNTQ